LANESTENVRETTALRHRAVAQLHPPMRAFWAACHAENVIQ
jgi:hypothetical protein